MLEPVREFFVKDGYVLHTWEYDPTWNKRKKTVYEVLRVIDGIPLFENEHIERLMQSASSAGFRDASPVKAHNSIEKLISANPGENGNVLCCIIANKESHHILSWYVKHHYPTEKDYENGIKLSTLRAIRKNPAAKVWNSELRSKAEYLIKSTDSYEVLLIDKKKHVTEGSRSNIFFVRGNSVYTPPENKVLKGITRQKILQICAETGITVVEQELHINEIPLFEAAFITGTSPGVLAVNAIEEHRFNTSNQVIKKLMAAYGSLVIKSTSR